MKGIILCLLGLIGTIVNGQQLENSSWTSIKITRKDGSAILPGLYGNLPFYAIRFDDGKAQITTGFNYFNSKVYQIDKANLTIENQVDYTIEFFDDTLLVYSAGKPDNSDLEKVNRYYLMNDRFYLDYLSENSLLPNMDDSIISATNYLYPRYKGEGLYSELLNFVTTKKITGALTGTLIINSEGEVYSFQARDIKSISVKDQEALEDFFLQTYGKWEIPYHLKKSFRIDFLFRSENPMESYYKLLFKLNTDFEEQEKEEQLQRRAGLAVELYVKGERQLSMNHYDKALNLFNECLKNDSTNLDAYYGKALALYHMVDLKAACEVWKLLESWEQKKAGVLVKDYCKE